MVEYENTHEFSADKYQSFIEAVNSHSENIKRCATIINKLEWEYELPLTEKDELKLELGNLIDTVKADSSDIIDSLISDYQVFDATAPRVSQNLSGFKTLNERIVNKDKNVRVNPNEADDSSFYY
ncbi:TPA: hypothetical protein PDP79_002327 [Staphylococcus aureus]|nr:hypothetical protein [Staphylococcus aureus]HDF6210463.1 hypothetical protein [Staphylococcus aureus]HDF8578575.1 hypothetical protein [Staphylococcus aureus]